MKDPESTRTHRRFSLSEKIAIVRESFSPGITASHVARRHGIAVNVLYYWRKVSREVADTDLKRCDGRAGTCLEYPGRKQPTNHGWWAVEPDVGRVAHGVPSRVDRLYGLGNAVVPQVAEHVGRQILAAHLMECAA